MQSEESAANRKMAYQGYKMQLLLFCLFSAVSAAAIGLLSRTVGDYIEMYTAVSKDTRLMGTNRTVTTRSFLQCVVRCSILKDCSAANFCNNTCELLSNISRLVSSEKTETCWISLALQPQVTVHI